MKFYTSLFDDSQVVQLIPQPDGKVMLGMFTISNQLYMCIDSSVKHEWGFTPAVSIFVTCDTADEIDRLYAALSDGGNIHMELSPSPFSAKFAWVNDRFGVSWQLNLPKAEEG